MAKIESDQTVPPQKEPAGHTADVGDGKVTVAPHSPPGASSPTATISRCLRRKNLPVGEKANRPSRSPSRLGSPETLSAKVHAKKSGGRGERKQPVDKGLPPRPGKPKRKARTKSPPQKSAAGPGGVGYRNPPIDTRSKPGESANIQGRPLGAKNKVRAFGVEQLQRDCSR